MWAVFGNLRYPKTNHRVDRIFRIVGYGTILVLLCFADVFFEPPVDGAAARYNYLTGKIFITSSLVGVLSFLLLRSLRPRGGFLIQSLSPYSRRLVRAVSMGTSICFLLLIGVAYSGDLLGAGRMVFIVFLSLPLWLPLLLIVAFLSGGQLKRGLALAVAMYCTLFFVSMTIRSISRDFEDPWWIQLVPSLAALASLIMTGMTVWTYYTLPRDSHDLHKLLGEFSALRGTIIIATGVYFCDAFVLNQGALALVLFVVVLFYFAPATMWALRTDRRLASLRFYKAAIYVMAATAILFTNALQNRMADAKAVKLGNACLAYRAKYHHYPTDLGDLVPEFISSVPPAKYTLTGRFFYDGNPLTDNDREPMLYYVAMPPFGRRFYHMESRSWGYLD